MHVTQPTLSRVSLQPALCYNPRRDGIAPSSTCIIGSFHTLLSSPGVGIRIYDLFESTSALRRYRKHFLRTSERAERAEYREQPQKDDEEDGDVDISDTELEKGPIFDPDEYTPSFRVHVPMSLVGPIAAEEKALEDSFYSDNWSHYGDPRGRRSCKFVATMQG